MKNSFNDICTIFYAAHELLIPHAAFSATKVQDYFHLIFTQNLPFFAIICFWRYMSFNDKQICYPTTNAIPSDKNGRFFHFINYLVTFVANSHTLQCKDSILHISPLLPQRRWPLGGLCNNSIHKPILLFRSLKPVISQQHNTGKLH